jgi:DNA-binding NarL/FixJ family response regulator
MVMAASSARHCRIAVLAYDIALGIAPGGFALGTIECTESDVLYLALEDSRRRLKDRALALCDGNIPKGCKVVTKWPCGAEGIAALELYLSLHPRCRVVIIDVLARFKAQSREGNGSVYDADYASLKPLQEMAARRDIAIIVLHHSRKAESDDMIDLASGTLGLTGAADHIMVLRSATDKSPANIEVTGRDLPNTCTDIEFRQGRWFVLGPSQKKSKSLSTVERIDRDAKIRKLHGDGLSQHKIAEQLGIAVGTVNQVLKKSANDEDYDADA